GQPEALDLQDVAEAPGDQEPQPGAVPLDDRVDRDGRAVNQVADVGGADPALTEEGAQPLHEPAGRVRRHRRPLEADQPAGLRVEQAEVGEGSSDVDAEAIRWHAALLSWRGSRARDALLVACSAGCRHATTRLPGLSRARRHSGATSRFVSTIATR